MAGLFYEDFEIGREYETAGRTITETDLVTFAYLSGDYNPLHTDVEFAKQTVWGQRLVYGVLGFVFASGLRARLGIFEGTVIAFLGMTWDFKGPMFIGDTIRSRVSIVEKRETKKSDRGIVRQKVQLLNQRGEVVQEGVMTQMMRRCPAQVIAA
ncbi:MAG: MaoC/PaaZ C-terminal domain-containing protein [Rubrivivax sp.]